MGFAAVGQLTRRCGRLCGASLSLGSVLHHQTSTGRPLAGLASCERPCLVDGGFPPSGPQEDLTYCMSHLVVLCSCRAHPGLRTPRVAPAAPLDTTPATWSEAVMP